MFQCRYQVGWGKIMEIWAVKDRPLAWTYLAPHDITGELDEPVTCTAMRVGDEVRSQASMVVSIARHWTGLPHTAHSACRIGFG